jgi:hypothetical protein
MNYPFNLHRIRLECIIRNLVGGIIDFGDNGSNIIFTGTFAEMQEVSGVLLFDRHTDHVADMRGTETAGFSNVVSQIFLQSR